VDREAGGETRPPCVGDRAAIGGIDFRARPLATGGRSQLSRPADHALDAAGREFPGNCRLFSFVAWDHVSWPGNDFYGGARATDDGVKAAATSAMEVITGVAGLCSKPRNEYLPPEPHRTRGLIRALGVTFQRVA
jgi:hypothetical protein